MTNKIYSPHDKIFRAAMTDLRVAKDFFQQHLPEKIQAIVNLSQLKLSKESFVDTKLRQSASDLLYSVKLNTKETGYLYLLAEHQSTPQRLMPFRLLKYISQIIDQHLKQNPNATLPVVYPLVFYNGEIKYPFSMDLFELFGKHQDIMKSILLTPFQLIDISQISDRELKKHPWAGLFEFMMKHIYVRDILPYVVQSFDLIRPLERADAEDYILATINYVMNTAEIEDKQLFIEKLEQNLPPTLGDKAMTMAEWLKNKGMQEGLEKGILQGLEKGLEKGREEERQLLAKRMIDNGATTNFIAQVTGLTLNQIKQLKKDR